MNSPSKLRIRFCARLGLLALLGAFGASFVRADPLQCDLGGYTSSAGLTAVIENDVLTVTWLGAADAEVRARYAIDRAQPIVRELAICASPGGEWTVLGEN